ncbi:hypothetical protein HYZ76_02080 [Candidatus Falkowbacteria bacterium]|nr:hypothetical protein [Candidatus Falkowbacteria bacterium]
MLDIVIIEQLKERERRKREWQPEPLYLPLEAPRPPQKKPAEELDIWQPDENEEDGVIVIQTSSYVSFNRQYQ